MEIRPPDSARYIRGLFQMTETKTANDALSSDARCDTVELALGGMTCAACAARIERQLNKLPGVEAAVNFAAERAHVRFAPSEVDVQRLISTVVKTGFTADVSTADTRAEEKARKLAQYHEEQRRFWISAALTLPLVAQMVFMFGANGSAAAHDDVLPRWLQFAAGDAGAVLDRLALLRRRLQRPARRRRQHGRARRARHDDGLGCSASSSPRLDLHHHHVYFEASASVITLVLLGKLLEARAKAKTSAAIEALAPAAADGARRAQGGEAVRTGRRARGDADSRRRLRRAAGRERCRSTAR
jgi:Cu+-exporting ATPase